VKILKLLTPPWLARMAGAYLVDFRNCSKIIRESSQDETGMAKMPQLEPQPRLVGRLQKHAFHQKVVRETRIMAASLSR
jgi:hypothetical protein